MRKWIYGSLLTLALVLLFALPASAQSIVLDKLYASVEIPDTYVVITPDNTADFADWLQGRGTTSEEAANDMQFLRAHLPSGACRHLAKWGFHRC